MEQRGEGRRAARGTITVLKENLRVDSVREEDAEESQTEADEFLR